MKLVDALKMKKIALLFLCSCLISCGNNKSVPIPDNVLSKEKMALVMTDMHLLEASMNLNIASALPANQNVDMEAKVQAVLKKNAVTKEQYETSFVFYSTHTELLSEIYTEVLNDLSKLQAKVANEKTPNPSSMIPVKDSSPKVHSKMDSIKKPLKEHPKMDSISRQPDHLKSLHNKKRK
jgi:hypothetical protein